MKKKFNFAETQLSQQLAFQKQKKFTGRLEVKSSHTALWTIYFCLGRIVWADGGPHRYRSWKRHLAKYCSQIELDKNILAGADNFECWKYRILTILSERKLINLQQLTGIIESQIAEIIFDLIQLETTQEVQYTCQPASAEFLLASGLKISFTLVYIDKIIDQVQNTWLNWYERGLETISPHLAPTIKNQEQIIEKKLFNFIDGNHTIRDLAAKSEQDLSNVALSLFSYINSGILELKEIPDETGFLYSKFDDLPQFLVACIDDSPQVTKIMDRILSQEGYQFIGINEPLQAIPQLIKSHPNLIFLDIGMPIINGYELAAQLRRVSLFKKTPLVMLTGKDGIIDRVRAKVIGATDFIAKPIDPAKIINTVEKFSLALKNSQNQLDPT